MNSNVKTIVTALVASVLIVSVVLVGVLVFMGEPRPEPVDVVEVQAVATPGPEAPAEPPETPGPDIDTIEKKSAETLTVKVLDASTGIPIRTARILVQKAAAGDQPGEIVYPRGRRSSGASSGGEFQVSLLHGSYLVKAYATRYSSQFKEVKIFAGKSQSIEMRLNRGLSISGRVLDRGRKGIGGARVLAYEELGSPEDDPVQKLIDMSTKIVDMTQEPPVETISAPDGSYQLDGLKEVHYTVTAFAAGYTPKSRKNVRPSREGVDLILPEGSEFAGVVIDGSTAAAIEGAEVRAYPELNTQDIFEVISTRSRPPLETVKTGSAGEFVFTSLGSGVFNLYIKADGYQPGRYTKIPIRSGTNDAQTFSLKPGLILAGRVLDPEGAPVAGARVRPIRSEDTRADYLFFISFDDGSVQTDEEGRFQFGSLEPGKHSLLAWHDDYAANQIKSVELGNTNVEIRLTRGGAISGTVIEAVSGKPVAGCRILVNDILDIKKEGITDENGEYSVLGLSTSRRGKRYVTVQAEGYARVSNRTVDVQEGRVTTDVNFELMATASITGRVVNSNGDPVARARVMARRPGANTPVLRTVGSAVSDGEGRYFISDVEAGDETVLEVLSSDYLEARSNPFAIEAGDQLDAEDMVLSLGGSIAGVVIDPEGRGVSGSVVSTRTEGETTFNQTKTATTDSRGRFRLRGLLAGGYDLHVKSTSFLDEIVQGVPVREAEETPNLRIQVRRGNRLAGVVVDGEGKPVNGALVAVGESVQGYRQTKQSTDTQGRFSFNSLLAEDTVEIEVTHSDYSGYSNPAVKVGVEDLTIALESLGGVKGVVLDSQGSPVGTFSVQPRLQAGGGAGSSSRLQARTIQNTNGYFEYEGVPAGVYSVSVSAPGHSARTIDSVEVNNGELADLGEIVLEEGGIIDGVVFDARTRRPLSGVRVRVQGGSARFAQDAAKPAAGSLGSTFSGERGHFEFRNLRGGSVTLIFRHTGYVTQKVTDVDANDASTSRNLQVAMEVGSEIVGFVADASGKRRGGVQVYLQALGDLDASANQNRQSDSNGKFRFTGLAPGRYRVRAFDFKRKDNPFQEVAVASGGGSVEVPLVYEE